MVKVKIVVNHETGGEYETLTLDTPFYKKKIVMYDVICKLVMIAK